jgi:hypothetical protein
VKVSGKRARRGTVWRVATELEALGDQGFACSFDDAAGASSPCHGSLAQAVGHLPKSNCRRCWAVDRLLHSRALSSAQGPVQIQILDLLPSPRCASQELQARFDTRIELKTANVDQLAELLPTVAFEQRV